MSEKIATLPGVQQETIVTAETHGRATLHQRAIHEFKEFAILAVYLYLTLGAVIMMKTAVLHSAGFAFEPFGIAIVKAMVLAKFMLVGHAMKLGERFTNRPLIWPTLHKAVAFLLLLIVMTVIEEVVVGLFHGRSIAVSIGELLGARLEETIVGYFIMLLVLTPYFAVRVLDEALGEGRLARMFFVAREPAKRP
jgi:hypothetical protein